MTEHTLAGGTTVAEPPVPMAPVGAEVEDDGSRRKLALVGAVVAVLVLLIAAFFLMKGHGGSGSDQSLGPVTPGVAPVHHAKTTTGQHPIKLPKTFKGAVGRDPFTPLYTLPKSTASSPAKAPKSSSSDSSTPSTTPVVVPPTTGNGGGKHPGTTPAASFAPVWVELVSLKGTKSATFTVQYSNGKQTKTTTFTNVAAPSRTLRTTFGNVFALLSIQDHTVTVQFGDATPFDLAPGFGNRHFVG
jgi:hypothetical protein